MADRTIRIGKVSSVDYGSGMIKVTYPDLDNSVTDDLPYFCLLYTSPSPRDRG